MQMRFDLHLARSKYWIAYSETNGNKSRHVTCAGKKLTEDELVDNAIGYSNHHLDLAQKIMEELNSLG